MNADNSHSPRKGFAVLFWTGIVLALMGIASIWAAETFMADNPQGQKGVLIFYRTFGPFTLAWTAIAALTFVYLRTHRNGNRAA